MPLDRHTATMLAALRLWQKTPCKEIGRDLLEIANDSRRLKPLTVREIDEVCDQIVSGDGMAGNLFRGLSVDHAPLSVEGPCGPASFDLPPSPPMNSPAEQMTKLALDAKAKVSSELPRLAEEELQELRNEIAKVAAGGIHRWITHRFKRYILVDGRATAYQWKKGDENKEARFIADFNCCFQHPQRAAKKGLRLNESSTSDWSDSTFTLETFDSRETVFGPLRADGFTVKFDGRERIHDWFEPCWKISW